MPLMRYTSRKLIVAIALVALVTWLLLIKAISEAAWLELVKLSLGGYLAANIGQKAVEAAAGAFRGRLRLAPAEQPDAGAKT